MLTGAQLNTELVHNKPVVFPKNDNTLKELLGENFKTATHPYENKVGTGKVIFFPVKKYPADASIKDQYIKVLKEIGDSAIAGEF